MPFEQTRNLHGDFLAPTWRTRKFRHLCYILWHRDADATERLDAFGNHVYKFGLLLVVFVKQQGQGGKGRPRDLPVMLLVHVPENSCVGECLIQCFDTRSTNIFLESNG